MEEIEMELQPPSQQTQPPSQQTQPPSQQTQPPSQQTQPRRHATGTFDQVEGNANNANNASPWALSRKLHPIHIFFVAIGAAIGMGFYVRTGQVEAISGPGTVLLAYLFLGVLAISIMQDLERLLQVWPVGNPLMEFVSSFVDEDVGIIVGILYWLTYCFSFAGLTTVLGNLIEELQASKLVSIPVSVFSLCIPICLNMISVSVFRHIEAFFGTIKMLLAVTFILYMIVINPAVAGSRPREHLKREVAFQYEGAGGWFGGFMIALLYNSFAFVGIEAIAATATEAVAATSTEAVDATTTEAIDTTATEAVEVRATEVNSRLNDSQPFKMPAKLIPQVTLVLYSIGGWIVTQNIAFDDERLPSVDGKARAHMDYASSSIFINAAHDYDPDGRSATVFTILLIINVVSTSSTALYIASRTFFGFANRFSGRITTNAEAHTAKWYHRYGIFFSKRNRYNVPYVAVGISSWVIFIPFLRYLDSTRVNEVMDLVVEMGSISCILVWSCLSYAACRFYIGLHRHDTLNGHRKVQDIIQHLRIRDEQWFWRHRVISAMTAFACVGIVIGGGILTYIRTSSLSQLIAMVTVCAIFICGTLLIKSVKYFRPATSPPTFVDKILDLNWTRDYYR